MKMKVEDILAVDHSPFPQPRKRLIREKGDTLGEIVLYIQCLPILESKFY